MNGGILDFLLHFYLSPGPPCLRLRGNLADIVMMLTMKVMMMMVVVELVMLEVMTFMKVVYAIQPDSDCTDCI